MAFILVLSTASSAILTVVTASSANSLVPTASAAISVAVIPSVATSKVNGSLFVPDPLLIKVPSVASVISFPMMPSTSEAPIIYGSVEEPVPDIVAIPVTFIIVSEPSEAKEERSTITGATPSSSIDIESWLLLVLKEKSSIVWSSEPKAVKGTDNVPLPSVISRLPELTSNLVLISLVTEPSTSVAVIMYGSVVVPVPEIVFIPAAIICVSSPSAKRDDKSVNKVPPPSVIDKVVPLRTINVLTSFVGSLSASSINEVKFTVPQSPRVSSLVVALKRSSQLPVWSHKLFQIIFPYWKIQFWSVL